MRKLVHRYRSISSKAFYLEVLSGFLVMGLALLFNNFANKYTVAHSTTSSVTDIILDHLPTLNIEILFVEGMIALIAFVSFLCLHRPARIPFVLKTCGLFIGVRAVFIMMTHLAPPANEWVIHTTNFLETLVAGADAGLFFSGHTGFPFLMMLIFWQDKLLRRLFFFASLFFGAVVLLGHLHYSIDVFSAFFIAYGVFHISLRLFKKDFELLEGAS